MACWWRLPSSGKTASQVIASSRCFCSLATWETCVTPGTWQTGHLGNQQGVHVVQPGGRLELLPSHWIFNPSLSQIVRGETKVLLDVQQAKGTTLPENFASWTAIGMALLMIILGNVHLFCSQEGNFSTAIFVRPYRNLVIYYNLQC